MFERELGDELRLLSYGPRTPVIDADKHPIMAKINRLSARLMRILGPVYWAAIIILWFVAEFSSK